MGDWFLGGVVLPKGIFLFTLKMHTASPVESSKGGPRNGILQGVRIPRPVLAGL